ncbi:aspartate aminotransferase family protein [Rhodospirillaceae bacterium KN72]|uniref:Aspartate aminotransferase family protein n=1 Tax=Pacificispira spongiicola TaxID=2729598 RepID=A0A7Y0HE05_9PROT|nr:pyridoxal-dependent decarboxylase [Pacificispira spongiicola]NMM44376.1 aspartate aminotransferase family protein [Pacificispira spongiicola]
MSQIHDDYDDLAALLQQALNGSLSFHKGLADRPVAARKQDTGLPQELPSTGVGGADALTDFLARYGDRLSASAGPRFLGFVTGGTTPAALIGDWLAASVDQNSASPGDSVATAVTVQALDWLKQLFNLPAADFDGAFTTGATAANFACLLAAREWAGEQAGYNIAQKGLAGGPTIRIYSACPHASFVKVTRFLGLGQDAIVPVDRIGDTEAMDPDALDRALAAADPAEAKIVCASAGTVTTTAFDDLIAISAVCKRHNAWMHVDGAFGLFARTVPELAGRTAGVEFADSITVDGHKWLNVPYDCGFYFTRRIDLIERAAGAMPAYLDVAGGGLPHYMNRALEGSQRFRALPVWLTLAAYGADGVRQIVRNNCRQAGLLAAWVERTDGFELLAPTSLNIVCFRGVPPDGHSDPDGWNRALLSAINDTGLVYLTPGAYGGKGGIRAAFSNWMTRDDDLDAVTRALIMGRETVLTEEREDA